MSLTAGTRLGPFEILAPIGAGGMGEVYKAKDTRLERTVAIKVLPEHFAESPERKVRFEREAKVISQLNHPHICTLYDVGEQDGLDYLVMEYIEGDTLAERLKKGALPLDEALEYGIQIADGLDKTPSLSRRVALFRQAEEFPSVVPIDLLPGVGGDIHGVHRRNRLAVDFLPHPAVVGRVGAEQHMVLAEKIERAHEGGRVPLQHGVAIEHAVVVERRFGQGLSVGLVAHPRLV